MLPRIFDTLRAMYGAIGPATKLYAECQLTRIALHEVSKNFLRVLTLEGQGSCIK